MSRAAIPDDRKDEVLHLCLSGYTDHQLAAHFHCSRITVIHFREKHGIIKQRGRNWNRTVAGATMEPILTYFDMAVNHMVKVYGARQASGDLQLEEEE